MIFGQGCLGACDDVIHDAPKKSCYKDDKQQKRQQLSLIEEIQRHLSRRTHFLKEKSNTFSDQIYPFSKLSHRQQRMVAIT